MAWVEYENGVRNEWDENITVGQLITTYNKGFHVLTRIEFASDVPHRTQKTYRPVSGSNLALYPDSPIFYYTQVLREDGSKSKAIQNGCSAVFCAAVTGDIAREKYLQESSNVAKKWQAVRTFL
jgi:hypothetical protein